MRTYNIYNMQNNELIGEVKASSVTDAEIKASEEFNIGSLELYALTKEN